MFIVSQMTKQSNPISTVNNKPRVSVCMPTYNAAKTIKKCLERILNQTVKPYEILVVDGHSQDETLKALQEYPNIKIIGFAKELGKARKILANNASGDILAWVDSDVIIPLNWIELNVQIHLERKDIVILSGKGHSVDAASVSENFPEVLCELAPVSEWLGSSQAACTMKKELFSVVNYDERFRRSEDWDLVISANRKGFRMHRCNGFKYFHITRSAKVYLKDMIYAGTYVLFLKKHGLWYVKFNPKHFGAFILRIALIYAVPLSFFFPLALLTYPVALLAYAIDGKTFPFSKGVVFKLLVEMMKGAGEHLYMFKLI